jgi:uncharacterized protein (DUF2235 family)
MPDEVFAGLLRRVGLLLAGETATLEEGMKAIEQATPEQRKNALTAGGAAMVIAAARRMEAMGLATKEDPR